MDLYKPEPFIVFHVLKEVVQTVLKKDF